MQMKTNNLARFQVFCFFGGYFSLLQVTPDLPEVQLFSMIRKKEIVIIIRQNFHISRLQNHVISV